MKTNSKSIGNTGERNIAKVLSIWIFNDQHVLKREPTSGGVKTVYCGDIFPMKPIEWEYFPFLIEVKWGYNDHTPTLYNFSIIEKWYLKAKKESQMSNKQDIILLICNFKGRQGVLLFTNTELNFPYKCILNIKSECVFCYNFKEIIKYDFNEIFK